MNELRRIPSVEKLLQTETMKELSAIYGRPLALQALRSTLNEARQSIRQKGEEPIQEDLIKHTAELLESWTAQGLLPVINATGVILHTNLGRAPLSPAAAQAMQLVSLGYSNLEFDLEQGQRGSRGPGTESLLIRLTGAEAALVVNNNAAAVLLALSALAARRAVVIARSQLVEIGGGFRIPDVMKQSRARLVEVGTTNRVHLSDFEAALEEKPALFLRAHRSNFRILGFTGEPSLEEIVQVAHGTGLPVVDDLGSGSLLETTRFGLGHEPMVQESLAAGADLVCFSGDKLLGGPQAGIILGRGDLIAKLKKHPLARAVRADKLCLAALNATLLHYLKDEAEREIPIWRMIATPPEDIKSRAESWAAELSRAGGLSSCQVIPGESTVGGGSLPGETLPTWLLALQVRSPDRTLARLRQGRPPVIARAQDGQIVLDPRTVLPEQESLLLSALREVSDAH
jgi:L-seryl-tRNA(Ser) seleniumtransferase